MNRELYLSVLLNALPDEITKEQLVSAVRESFFASYKLRMSISGRKAIIPVATTTVVTTTIVNAPVVENASHA